MSITIDLPKEIYERLEKQAQARGTTVAEVIARLIEEVEAAHREAVFEQMRAEGILLPKKPAQPGGRASFEPIEVRGRPVSEILIEERR
ncbi:MAG: ribbon-helix-helix domain-containing protein [Blastocatellia bacterium]